MKQGIKNISVISWLIVTLATFFPAGHSFSNHNTRSRTSGRRVEITYINSDNIVFSNHSELPEKKAWKTYHKARFLINQSYNADMLSNGTEFLRGLVPVYITQLYKYATIKASLPAYYAFLFRLSPF